MCDACEDWHAREPRQAALHPRLARRARQIERSLPGEPASDVAGRIALGQETGAISWTDHLRIVAAVQAAEAESRRPVAFAGRRHARLNCDAAS
jgi:hypothetical protein